MLHCLSVTPDPAVSYRPGAVRLSTRESLNCLAIRSHIGIFSPLIGIRRPSAGEKPRTTVRSVIGVAERLVSLISGACTMRVIIRFSIDGERNGAVRNALAWQLSNVGMQNTGTGTWEHQAILPANLALAMSGFWKVAGDVASVYGADPGVSIDHIWIYTDDDNYETNAHK
jgi:hypothetical protein